MCALGLWCRSVRVCTHGAECLVTLFHQILQLPQHGDLGVLQIVVLRGGVRDAGLIGGLGLLRLQGPQDRQTQRDGHTRWIHGRTQTHKMDSRTERRTHKMDSRTERLTHKMDSRTGRQTNKMDSRTERQTNKMDSRMDAQRGTTTDKEISTTISICNQLAHLDSQL